jgi:hypothetical protein
MVLNLPQENHLGSVEDSMGLLQLPHHRLTISKSLGEDPGITKLSKIPSE